MTLTGRLGEKGKRHEFLYMDIAQSYDIREERGADERAFSDVAGELILRPWTWAKAAAKGSYDVYDKRFENYDAALGLKDGRGNELDVAYRFILDSTEYLEARAGLRILKPIRITYLTRYSFEDDESIESSYGVEYTHQCWSAKLTYTDRLEEELILLTLNLKGVGQVLSASGELEK
jgi:hypothetical protein